MHLSSGKHGPMELGLIALFLWLYQSSASPSSSPPPQQQPLPVVEWLQTKQQEGAFVDPRLSFFEKQDGSIIVMALRDISKHEVLLKIPKTALVHDYTTRLTKCGLTEELLLAYNDKEHPLHLYVDYLKQRYSGPEAYHLFPMQWSYEGVALLEMLVGEELPPSSFAADMPVVADDCSRIYQGYDEESHQKMEDFWAMALALSWQNVMIPILDMIPHCGGGEHNVDFAAQPWWADHGNGNSSEPVLIHATKDIAAGQALFTSYTHCLVCENYSTDEDPLTTQNFFYELAWVEHYPQTWLLNTGYEKDPDIRFRWRVEPQEQEPYDLQNDGTLDPFQLKATWLTETPGIQQINMLNAHYNRLQDMAAQFDLYAQDLDPAEANRLRELYNAYSNAFKAAVLWARDGLEVQTDWNEQNCVWATLFDSSTPYSVLGSSKSSTEETVTIAAHSSTSESVSLPNGGRDHALLNPRLEVAVSMEGTMLAAENANDSTTACPMPAYRFYDDLMPREDPLDYQISTCTYAEGYAQRRMEDQTHHSHYQKIEFAHTLDLIDGTTDTCLTMVDFLQSCTQFRAHYHEYLVHYPVQFLKRLRRVLFLGGGDLMILHEIFKYSDDLELVVGMDLDQDVVRSSFRNFGILPMMDDPKMQWWFGDAAKSLLMLPKEYYGTFDLVLVDLQTYVSDYIKVTPTMTLMDLAMAMLQPDGVLSKNEDFVHRNRGDWAKHTVDLELHHLPYTCQQSITLMSNNVDFWNVDPVNHEVPTLFFEPSAESHFTTPWGHYHRRNDQEKAYYICLSEDSANATNQPMESLASAAVYGVMIVIEAENAAMSQADSSVIGIRIADALEELGLDIVSSYVNALNEEKSTDEEDSFFTNVFILEEGYVFARTWSQHDYCAFDVQLWTAFDSQDKIVNQLVTAVEGDREESTTSYRIVTGGMAGIVVPEKKIYRNAAMGSCETKEESAQQSEPVDPRSFGEVTAELINVLIDRDDDSFVVVLCGDKASPCKSLQGLQSSDKITGLVEPLWLCPNFDSSKNYSDPSLFLCERETRANLLELIEEHGRINAMVIDSNAPRVMGQVLHKIMNTTRVRVDLFEEAFVILATDLESDDRAESASWTSALLERFRTEMIQFNPVYHVDAVVVGGDAGFGMFSTGNERFYELLIESMATIQRELGVVLEVQDAKAGIINYVPDLQPKVRVTNEDYDQTEATEQWYNQNPLGQQALFQFRVDKKAPITVGEIVLYMFHDDGWHSRWAPGIVEVVDEEHDTYKVLLNNEYQVVVNRVAIQKVDRSPEELLVVLGYGDQVMVGESFKDKEFWVRGVVVGQVSDTVYQVQEYSDGFIYTVRRQDLIREAVLDRPQTSETETVVSKEIVESVLLYILERVDPYGYSDEIRSLDVGEGRIAYGFFSDGGSVVVTWDGKTQVDVNIFSTNKFTIYKDEVSQSVAELLPSSTLAFYDEQPRGIGGVVNLKRDLESVWFGDVGF